MDHRGRRAAQAGARLGAGRAAEIGVGARGLVQRNQGKWYPGEPLPRWQIGLHWRRDGQPLWNDESLLADPWGGENAEVEPDAAQQLLAALAAGLGRPPPRSGRRTRMR